MNSAARQGEASLESLHGWRELTCQEYEDAIRADDEAHVASSITDPDGVYGSPLTFTLWLMSDGSYLSTALEGRRDTEDYKCSHAITSGAPVEPVPAPRLEWVRATYYGSDKPVVPEHWLCPDWDIRLKEGERGECAWMNGKYELTTDAIHCDNYECSSSTYIDCFETVDAAKSLAEKLNDVLSPPVGTQE